MMLGLVRLSVADRATGNAVTGATVTVLRAGLTIAPPLYADPLGAQRLLSNVLATDGNAEVVFWVDGPVDCQLDGPGLAGRVVRKDPIMRAAPERRAIGIVGGSVEWRQQGGWQITAAQVTRNGDTFTATLPEAHRMAPGVTVRVSSRVRELRTDEVPVTVVDATRISYPATYPASGNAIPPNTAVNIAVPGRWSPESYLRLALMHESLGGRWRVVGAAANPGDNWPEITERTDEILALAAQCDVIVGSLGRDLGNALAVDGSGLLPIVRLLRQIRALGTDVLLAEWKSVDNNQGGSATPLALNRLEVARAVLYAEAGDSAGLEVVEWLRTLANPLSTTGDSLPNLHSDDVHINHDGAEACAEPLPPMLLRRSPGEPRPLRSWRADVWDESDEECPPGVNLLSGLFTDVAPEALTVVGGTPGAVTIRNGSTLDRAFRLRINGDCTVDARNLVYQDGARRTQDLLITTAANQTCTATLEWVGVDPFRYWTRMRAGHVYDVALHYLMDMLRAVQSVEIFCDLGVDAELLGAGLWHRSSFTQGALAAQRFNRPESGILRFPRPIVIPSNLGARANFRLAVEATLAANASWRVRIADGEVRRTVS